MIYSRSGFLACLMIWLLVHPLPVTLTNHRIIAKIRCTVIDLESRVDMRANMSHMTGISNRRAQSSFNNLRQAEEPYLIPLRNDLQQLGELAGRMRHFKACLAGLSLTNAHFLKANVTPSLCKVRRQ